MNHPDPNCDKCGGDGRIASPYIDGVACSCYPCGCTEMAPTCPYCDTPMEQTTFGYAPDWSPCDGFQCVSCGVFALPESTPIVVGYFDKPTPPPSSPETHRAP